MSDEIVNQSENETPKRKRGRPRKNPIFEQSYVIPCIPQTFPAQIPKHECRCQTCGNTFFPQTIDTQQHSVIQIKTGEYRGTLWLVGEVEGDTVHCYRIMPGGDKEFLETKVGEFHLISQVQKGMVAWKYEKPIKDKAPSWHEEAGTDQPQG